MADAMDTRIVEMQFENKDFEKNIQVSQKSLEKFKKELNFDETSRGIDKFSKSVKGIDFSVMESNIQKLTDKFTGLGTVGEFVLSRIRRTLESMGDKVISFANSLTTVQAQAGFVKYESLNKSVQTLKSATHKDEKEIYAVLERLTKYTDETSYDFAQGVTSISQLVSSGAATLEQAEKTVEGFYNYAAKAGADASTASSALNYSFVQAMQKGYLDWSNAKELSNRSLLTMDFKEQLLEEAVAVGTLTKENGKYYAMSKKGKKQKKIEVNATNLFNDSLQHQWANTKVLNRVMAKYQDTTQEFGAEAYAAAQRCTTFTDALNAWKDMLSTGWMTTYRTLFGDLGEAMSLFSAVCNKVSEALAGLMETRNKILEAWKDMGGRDALWGMLFGEMEDPDGNVLFEGAYGVLDIITQIGDMISDAWWNMVKNLMPKSEQDKLLDWVNSNIDALNAQLIKQGQEDLAITKPFESFEEFWNSDFAKGTGLREGAFGGGLNQATKDVQNFVQGIHDWFNTVDEESGTTRLEKLQKVLNAIVNTISFAFDIIGGIVDFFGMIGAQLEPSFDAIGTFFATLSGGLEDGEQAARNGGTIKKFFTSLAEILRPVTGAINSIVGALMNLLTAIFQSKDAGDGISGAWKTIKSVLSSVWNLIKTIAGPIVTFITSILNSLADLFRGGFSEENVEKFKSNVSSAFSVMLESLKTGLKPIYDKIKTFLVGLWNTVSSAVSKYFSNENTVGHKVLVWLQGIFTSIKGWLGQKFPGLTDSVGGFFGNIWSSITGWLQSDNKWEGIKNLWTNLSGSIADFFSGGFGGAIQKVKDAVVNFFTNLFGGVKSGVEEGIGEGKNGLKGMTLFEKIKDIFSNSGSFGEGLRKVFDLIKDFFKDLGKDALTAVAKIAGAGAIVVLITKAIKHFSKKHNEAAKTINGQNGAGMVEIKNGKADSFGKKLLKFIGIVGAIAAAVYLINKIGESFGSTGTLGEGIMKVINWLKDFFGQFTPATWALIAIVAVAIVVIFKVIKIITTFASGFEKLGDLLGGKFKFELTAKNENFGDKMLKIAGAIAALTACIYVLANMELEKAIQGIAGVIILLVAMRLFIGSMKKTVKDMKGGDVAKMVFGMIGIAVAIGRLVNALTPIAGFEWEQLGKMGAALGGIVIAMGIVMAIAGGLKFDWKAGAGMLLFAASIGVLINGLKQILQFRDETGKWDTDAIKAMAITLAALVAAISIIAAACKNTGTAIGQLAALGVAIAILIYALKQVTEVKTLEDFAKMGGTLVGIVLVLLGFIWAVGRMKNKGSLKDTDLWQLIGLAAGIAVLILALKQVADLEWEQIGKMGAVFGGLIVGILALITVVNLTSKESGRGLKKSGFLALIGLALGLIALILVLQTVANMEWEQLGKMGAVFGAIVVGIGALMLIANLTSKSENQRGLKGVGLFGGLIGICLGIWALIEVLKPLASFEWEDLGKMFAPFAVVIIGLMLMMRSLNKNSTTGKKKMLGMLELFVGVAALLYVAARSLVTVQNVNWTTIASFMLGLALMTTIISKTVAKSATSSGKKMLSILEMFAGIAGLMYVAGLSLSMVKDVNWDTIAAFMLGLSVMTAIVSTMLNKTSTTSTKKMGSIFVMALSISGMMVAMGFALSLAKDVNWDTIAAFALGLSVMTAIVSKMMNKSSTTSVKKMGSILVMALALSGIMIAMGYALKKVKGVSWEAIAAFSLGISVAMIAMAGAIAILSKIKLTDGLKGILLLVAAFAALSLIAPMIGEGIGQAIENVVSHLSAVGVNLAYFSEQMDRVNEANIEKAKRVVGELAGVVSSLTGFASKAGDMEAFATGVWEISVALNSFDSLTGQIKGPEENGAIQLLEWFKENAHSFDNLNFDSAAVAIASLGAGLWIFDDLTKEFPKLEEGETLPALQFIETLSQMKETINGLDNIGSFGVKVGRLGSGLNNFMTSTGTIEEGADQSPGVKLLEALASHADGINTLTGLDLSGLADKLSLLGGGMAIYADAATQLGQMGEDGTEVPDVSAAVGILEQVVEQLSGETGELTLPTLPSVEQSGNFGTQMAALAGGLKQFIQASEGITGNTQKGLDAIGFLSSIKTNLTNDLISFVNATGSTEGWDETSLAAFGTDLGVLASGLTGFIGASEGITGNTQKGLDAIGFLSDINGKLTDQVIQAVKFFKENGISATQNTMLAQLGVDLVTLADGLVKFCAVEVPDNIDESLNLLDYFATLNEKLTAAKIDETAKMLGAYVSPIDKELMGSEGYNEYVMKALESQGQQTSAIAAFTFGIKELGSALAQFVQDTAGYFTEEYKDPIEGAKKAIEFFQIQFNLMPKIDRGFLSSILNYSQDLSDLAQPIIQLGPALANFSNTLKTEGFDSEVAQSAADVIATLVSSFASIQNVMDDMLWMVTKFSENGNTQDLRGYFKSLGENVENLVDGGRMMRWLGKQLNYVITSMTDTEYSSVGGKSVLDNFLELVGALRDKMDEMNIKQEDVDRVSSSFTTLSNLVAVFHPDNYPTDNSISNYLNALLQDIHSVLFKDGQKLPYEINEITDLFNSMSESLNALLTMTSGYTSVGTDSLKQAGKDFGTYLGSLMDAVWEYMKGATPYAEDYDDQVTAITAYLTDLGNLSEVINNIASGVSLFSAIPDIDESLGSIGHTLAEGIANGISDDLSIKTIRNAITSMIGGTVKNIMFDPSLLLGSGMSLTQKVGRNLMTNAKTYMNSWTDAFRQANTNDVMTEFRNVLNSQDDTYTASFQDLGFFMGLLIAEGVADSKDALIGSLKNLIGTVSTSVLYDLKAGIDNENPLSSYIADLAEDTPIKDVMDSLRLALNDEQFKKQWSFEDVGFYLSAGLALGVSNGTYLIENACRAAVAAARAAAMNEADAHSPSLVFAEIGGFLSSGMAIGITKGQKDVENAATGMTGSVITSATEAMSTFAAMMSQEIDADPTITPIVDMTNIMAAGTTLDQMLGKRDLELSANGNRYARDNVPRSDQTTSDYKSQDLSWIKESIANLGTQINAMGNKISNMQIVLDSGGLVGAVTDGVNKNLGSKTTYRRRRN